MGLRNLAKRDLLAVLDYAAHTAATPWTDDDPSALLKPLADLISCDFVTLSVIDVERHHSWSGCFPEEAIWPEQYTIFAELVDQHPYVQHNAATGLKEPQRLSDLMPARDWHDTGLYSEHFVPLRAKHQLCALLGSERGTLIGLGFSRSSVEFTDRDVDLVAAAQPHLGAAFRSARQLADLQAKLDAATPEGAPTPRVTGQLTQREEHVLLAMTQGLSDKQIATALQISPRTVHKHVEHVLSKLNAPNRTAAALTFVARGHPAPEAPQARRRP